MTRHLTSSQQRGCLGLYVALCIHITQWAFMASNEKTCVCVCVCVCVSSSSECSAQGQVIHCKRRNQGCRSFQRHVFHCKLRNQGCSFTRDKQVRQLPVAFRTPLSLSSASEQTLKIYKDPRGSNVEVRRMDLANWAFQTPPKFTTGVKYQFRQGFQPDQRSGKPNHHSPPFYMQAIYRLYK